MKKLIMCIMLLAASAIKSLAQGAPLSFRDAYCLGATNEVNSYEYYCTPYKSSEFYQFAAKLKNDSIAAIKKFSTKRHAKVMVTLQEYETWGCLTAFEFYKNAKDIKPEFKILMVKDQLTGENIQLFISPDMAKNKSYVFQTYESWVNQMKTRN